MYWLAPIVPPELSYTEIAISPELAIQPMVAVPRASKPLASDFTTKS